MRHTHVEEIANAVLYEGYILYPYRPTSVKNRQRWTFGGVAPQAWSQAHGEFDPWRLQTECLVQPGSSPILRVQVRFLHLMARTIHEVTPSSSDDLDDHGHRRFHPVESLAVEDRVYTSWQEAVERRVEELTFDLRNLIDAPEAAAFTFPGHEASEELRGPDGVIVGSIKRRQEPVHGAVEVLANQLDDRLIKIAIRVLNTTPVTDPDQRTRDEALLQSMVSTHVMLTIDDGEFISLLDPPDRFASAAADCSNAGLWPVLVGEEGQHDTLLASPIILYDYPQIAPESPGNLFDGTEIDEILSLRILAMTDGEKAEMRQIDERARALLDRTEALTGEQFMQLHGTMRPIRPEKGHQ